MRERRGAWEHKKGGGQVVKRLEILVCGALAAAGGTSAMATVLHVPGQYPTIQAGINAALEGDTVLVADGTYTGDGNRDLDFCGVNTVVMSENGPEATTIDCEGDSLDPHRGFYFHSGEDSTAVVQGFTIRNGYAAGPWPDYFGGGIRCENSSPTIVGNTIRENESAFRGGGVAFENCSPTLTGNAIRGNAATCGGGGIHCTESSATVAGNTIRGNVAMWGGGIDCFDHASPTIVGNTIAGNGASQDGGAINVSRHSTPTIESNMIVENWAYMGGGIECFDHSAAVIVSNIISDNSAELGGGIHCEESSPVIPLCQ